MARYDYANRNTGYMPFGRTTEPAFGGGMMRYSASQSSERYVASTEQVVKYTGFPSTHEYDQDHKHSPTRTEVVHRDHGVGDHNPRRPSRPILVPWSSASDQPEKAREHSPGVGGNHHQAVRQGQNSRGGNSSPPIDHGHPYGKYKNYSSDDDDDYECDEDGVCYNSNYKGGPNPNNHQKHISGNRYGTTPPNTNYVVPTDHQPRKDQYYDEKPSSYNGGNSYHDQGKKGNTTYSPPSYTANPSATITQPRKDGAYYDQTSHNPNDHSYVVPTIPSTHQPRQDPYYDEKPSSYNGGNNYYHDQGQKGSKSYSPPSYTTNPSHHVSTQPRNSSAYYDQTSHNPNDDNNDQKHKGNVYNNSPPSRPVHFAAQQKKEPYYNNNNDQPSNKGSPLNSPRAPIRTRTDAIRRGDGDFSPEKGRNSPVSGASRWSEFSSSPRKQEETIIDSEEARRRYGGAAVGGRNKAEEKYNGPIIDSRDAARRYNGVFVTK